MIEFINKRYNREDIVTEGYKVVHSQIGDVQTLTKIVERFPNLIITDMLENFKITNKGGCRLINYVKALLSAGACFIGYDSAVLSYLIETEPAKLYNYSEFSENKLITPLKTPEVTSWRYDFDTATLIPKDFTTSTALFNWLLKNESELCVDVFNQMKELKTRENLLDKDIKYFSDELGAVTKIANRYQLNRGKVLEAFSSYVL